MADRETDDGRFGRRLRLGMLGWCGFAVAAVALRGVRWDENYEFAQAILGLVPYDPGHPLFVYTRGLYTIQTWSLAALLALHDGPLLANGLRNVLALLATVIPVYLLAAHLARRTRAGHLAATLALAGIHAAFYSNYPHGIWPGLYSNGAVGTGWAVATVALLASPAWRPGMLLAGLMPMVHLGQFPPVLLLALVRAGHLARAEGRPALRAVLARVLPGIAACILFALAIRPFHVDPAVAGPYASDVPAAAVLQGYMTHFASHRAVPWGTGHLLLGGALVLYSFRSSPNILYRFVFFYLVLVASLVWGTMALHLALGPGMPTVLLGWMPYRLANHAGPLLVAGAAASLVEGRSRAAGPTLAATVALVLAVVPWLGAALPEPFYARYLSDGSWSLFVLWGGALLVGCESRFVSFRVLIIASVTVILGFWHQFGAGCVLAGAAWVWGGSRVGLLQRWVTEPRARSVVAAAAGLLLVSLLAREWGSRAHLPVSRFEGAVRTYLADRGEGDALLVARYHQEGLQARTGHPVMTDMASLTWIPYRPSLGPAFAGMYRDLYGLDLAPGPGADPMPVAWHAVWPEKTSAEWRRLGERYGFRYVVAPGFMELPLKPVVEGVHERLYRVGGEGAP